MKDNAHRLVTLLLSGAIGLLGLAAVWAMVQSPPESTIRELNDFNGYTPTPEILSHRPVTERLDELELESPAIVETMRAWLNGDVENVIPTVRSTHQDCSTSGSSGKSLCEWLDIPAGTSVELFVPSAGMPAYAISGQEMGRLVEHLLKGRGAAGLFVAEAEHGQYMLGMGVDPGPPFDYGGSDPGSNPNTVAVYLTIERDGKVTNISELSAGSPPLEPIREKLRAGESWTVTASSDAFRAWEGDVYATIEADRRQPPK